MGGGLRSACRYLYRLPALGEKYTLPALWCIPGTRMFYGKVVNCGDCRSPDNTAGQTF